MLTDNGSCYRSFVFAAALAASKTRHKRTRPYRPQTNGKVERYHRTLAREWAYSQAWDEQPATHRRASLAFLDRYNYRRPHTALGGRPPISRTPDRCHQPRCIEQLAVDVVHSGKHLMNAQLGRAGGEILRRSMAELGIGVFTGNRTTEVWGPDRVRGVKLRDLTEIDCDMIVVAAGIRPNTDVAATSGFTVERAIVVDDQMRTVDDDDVYAVGECVQHRGEVYGLVAPLWEQAVVLADLITGAEPARAVPRLADRHQAQGGRGRGRLDGRHRARAGHRRAHRVLRAQPGRLQVGRGPRRQGHRRDAARRQQEGRVPAAGLRPRAAAAGGAGRAAVRPGRSRRRRSASPRLADDAQVCNCNGVCKTTIVAPSRAAARPSPA